MAEGQPDSFFEAVREFEQAPYDALKAGADVLAEEASKGRLPRTRDLLPIAEEYDTSANRLLKWLRVPLHIIHYCKSHDDSIDAIVEDFKEQDKIESEDEFRRRLEIFSDEIETAYQSFSARHNAIYSSFPRMLFFDSSFVIAFSTEPHISRLADDNGEIEATEVTPSPVVSIQIDLEYFGTEKKSINFGVTRAQLDSMVKQLGLMQDLYDQLAEQYDVD